MPASRKVVILAPLRRKFERSCAIVALAMLIVAQLGAQLHTYAHREAGAPDMPRQTSQAGHGACSDCLAYAPLLASAGAPAALPPLAGLMSAGLPAPRLVSILDCGPILGFRSRAPPLAQTA